MNLEFRLNNAEVVKDLQAKGDVLEGALLQTVGSLGSQLYALVLSKILPVVRTPIGQEFYDSIQMQAAAFVDQVCMTSVGIDDEGQPSYIVAYVREWGHKAYDVYPLEKTLSEIGGVAIGQGIKSPHSDRGATPWKESRLPHALAWSEGGGMVFAKHVFIPASEGQSYLRSSLDEMQDEVKAQLTKTIAEVLAL